jgi:hypothetical protein
LLIFFVALTNYWRMYHAAGGSMHLVSHDLHKKYGPVVRMAPNYLDLDYPSLVSTCFDSHGIWKKVSFVQLSFACSHTYFYTKSHCRMDDEHRQATLTLST